MADDATPVKVTIQYADGDPPTLSLQPAKATIYGQGQLQWTLVGFPTSTQTTILFVNGCPFPATGDTDNPADGEYTCGNAEITTASVPYGVMGEWTYSVSVTNTDRRVPQPVDGGVIIDRNPP